MLTREYAWRVEQGEREVRTIPVLDGADPADITGWTVDAVIRSHHRAGATTLYTWPEDLVTIDGSDVILDVPAEVSLAWTFELGWYRVKITDPTEVNTQRVAQGVFVLDAD